MAPDSLDDIQAMRRIDPEGMLDRVGELPGQVRTAWERLQTFHLPDSYRQVRNIVACGLGGSAIGADLARSLVQDEAKVPIAVHRDYGLPGYAGPETLVIACSYSGGTEETLSAFDEGQRQGCRLLAMTPGGELGRRAQALGVPVLDYQYKSQPRAAMGFSFTLAMGILAELGQTKLEAGHIDEAVSIMETMQRQEIGSGVPESSNPAKQFARSLYRKLPVVYGTGILSEVARRYKTQFNENSKAWSFFEVFPELNHNAVVGYQFPPQFAKEFSVLFLDTAYGHPQNRKRLAIVQDLLSQAGIAYHTVEARGHSGLAQVLSTVHFGDYVSYYLAILNGADPTPVDTITYLKNRLAGQQ